MKVSEMRELSVKELNVKLEEARKNLLEMRFKMTTKQDAKTSDLGKIKKDIARLQTIIKEKEGA
ncbi:MAG: 50S ribosomal protein L29 [Chloroflexi bacterium]|nr:50S ribosomal protein L29 [Chloroflexota bacterium]